MQFHDRKPAGGSLAIVIMLAATFVAPGSTAASGPQSVDAGAGAALASIRRVERAPDVTAAVSTASTARVYYGEELMRLTNLDRVALGKRRLYADPVLMALARDVQVPCPGNRNLVIRGRARDMADRSYFEHAVKGCRTASGGSVTFTALLAKLGYKGWTRIGENIGMNSYGSGTLSYRIGCPSRRLTGCHGSTPTAWPVAEVQRQFMNSSAHRANLLDARYDRFGCGAWHRDGSAVTYFTCIFARGGNKTLDRSAPVVSNRAGAGTTIPAGGSFTFTASATDARTSVAEAWVTVDGHARASWAVDLPSSTLALSYRVSATGLAVGTHTLVWYVRDAGANLRSGSLRFSVGATAAVAGAASAGTRTSSGAGRGGVLRR